jgi:phosphoribosylformylglycinamidine cyclo-ligase
VFREIQHRGGVSDEEMARVFNCGIGMVAVVAKDGADALVRLMQEWGESPVIIGEVTPPGGEKSSAKGKGDTWAVKYEGVLKCQ